MSFMPPEPAASRWEASDSGLLVAIAEATTTEVADFLFGGVLPCTMYRFGAIIRKKLPYVGSVGAVKMVNFGSKESVPEKFKNRKLYVHNEQVTLLRTPPRKTRRLANGSSLD